MVRFPVITVTQIGLIDPINRYHHIVHYKKRTTHLIAMMSALITDLNLSRMTSVNERMVVTIEETKDSYNRGGENQVVRTLEERRAYLGAFFLSSSMAKTFRDLNAVQRTGYLEDCCCSLEKAAEYPTDRFLVSLLRLQNIAERVSHAFQYGPIQTHTRHNWRVPLPLYIVSFERDFQTYKNGLSTDLRQNSKWQITFRTIPRNVIFDSSSSDLLLLHYYSAMAYLYEHALYEPIQETHFGQPGFRRMEYLFECLQTIKSFHEVLFMIPSGQYYHMPFIYWAQVTHALITVSKLCFLDAADWNVAYAREESKFSELLGQVSSRLEEARAHQNSEADPVDNAQDVFIGLARRMRTMKSKYDSKVAADLAGPTDGPPTTFPVAPNQYGDATTMDILCNLEDDAFWQELMGSTWNPPTMEMGV